MIGRPSDWTARCCGAAMLLSLGARCPRRPRTTRRHARTRRRTREHVPAARTSSDYSSPLETDGTEPIRRVPADLMSGSAGLTGTALGALRRHGIRYFLADLGGRAHGRARRSCSSTGAWLWALQSRRSIVVDEERAKSMKSLTHRWTRKRRRWPAPGTIDID